jgi:hypothetical protein
MMTPVGRILLTLMADPGSGLPLPDLLCRAAAERLSLSGVSLAVMNESGSSDLVAASHPWALDLAQVQLLVGEGPCLDAFEHGRLVQQPDLARTGPGRWPAYAHEALASGVGAVFSFPLRIGAIRLGVLELFRDRTGPLLSEDLAEALHFADAAVLVLLYLQRASEYTSGDLEAFDSSIADAFQLNSEVHQATGMVSVQGAVSLAEALLLLRARAFAEGQTIGDVSRAVVTRTLRFDSA